MERDAIQVEKLSLSTHCPGIDRRIHYLFQGAEYGEEGYPGGTLSLTIHCPGIERRIRYLLASCRVWRGMISRWKSSS
jgi:hypothetical protein